MYIIFGTSAVQCVYIYIHRIYLYNMYILYIIISTGIMCKNDPITLKIRLFSWGRHECSLPGQDPSSTTSKVLPPGVLCKVHHANICLHPASMPPRMHAVIEWQYLSIYGMVWRWLDIICTFPEQQWGERKRVRHQHQHLPRQLANQLDGHAAAPVASSETVWLQPTRVAGHLVSLFVLGLHQTPCLCLMQTSGLIVTFMLWHVVARAPTESNARDVT